MSNYNFFSAIVIVAGSGATISIRVLYKRDGLWEGYAHKSENNWWEQNRESNKNKFELNGNKSNEIDSSDIFQQKIIIFNKSKYFLFKKNTSAKKKHE